MKCSQAFLNRNVELKRYGQEQNVKEEDFLEEQYELNSTIFRKNFSLIVQSLGTKYIILI